MDATRAAVGALSAAGIEAYGEVPADRPARFASVMRTGGARGRVLETARLSVDCWAGTRRESAELADEAADALLRAPDSDPNVFGALVESVYWNPDPDSGAPRTCVNAEFRINN